MINDPPNREDAIVEAALDLPLAARAAFLDKACGEDVPLRQLVEALLRVHAHGGTLRVPPRLSPPPSLSNSGTSADKDLNHLGN